MRIESAALEYIDGKLKIILEKNDDRKEELEFNLFVPLVCKLRLETIQYDLQDKKNKKSNNELLTEQMDVLKEILSKSYPNQTKEWGESILMRYGHELMLELFFIWGWRDREAYKAMVEAKKKTIQDLKTNPEKYMNQSNKTLPQDIGN